MLTRTFIAFLLFFVSISLVGQEALSQNEIDAIFDESGSGKMTYALKVEGFSMVFGYFGVNVEALYNERFSLDVGIGTLRKDPNYTDGSMEFSHFSGYGSSANGGYYFSISPRISLNKDFLGEMSSVGLLFRNTRMQGSGPNFGTARLFGAIYSYQYSVSDHLFFEGSAGLSVSSYKYHQNDSNVPYMTFEENPIGGGVILLFSIGYIINP